jgi:hypothetical protein
VTADTIDKAPEPTRRGLSHHEPDGRNRDISKPSQTPTPVVLQIGRSRPIPPAIK